jgi:hypothetical protein
MKKNRILTILLFLILSGFIGYNYIYQDHRDIVSEQPEYITTANEISNEFNTDLLKAEKKYLNKTIEIEGIPSEINDNSITLDDKVFCQLVKKSSVVIKNGTKLIIKGRLIGYDNLLEQVKLDQSEIVKN